MCTIQNKFISTIAKHIYRMRCCLLEIYHQYYLIQWYTVVVIKF